MTDLRQLAEAAIANTTNDRGEWMGWWPASETEEEFGGVDARFIAGCCPRRILALLDAVDKARAYLNEYEGVYDCVDNDGDRYQSQFAADRESELRAALARVDAGGAAT